MRVLIDLDRCLGNARCVAVAPDVFDVDDDGVVFLVQESWSTDRDADVELAVRSCPTGALQIAPSVVG
jgi:ferredoxin